MKRIKHKRQSLQARRQTDPTSLPLKSVYVCKCMVYTRGLQGLCVMHCSGFCEDDVCICDAHLIDYNIWVLFFNLLIFMYSMVGEDMILKIGMLGLELSILTTHVPPSLLDQEVLIRNGNKLRVLIGFYFSRVSLEFDLVKFEFCPWDFGLGLEIRKFFIQKKKLK